MKKLFFASIGSWEGPTSDLGASKKHGARGDELSGYLYSHKECPVSSVIVEIIAPSPTSSSPPVEDRPSSAPKDTVEVAPARLQELPSVCSPFHQSRTDLSASAESAPPQLGGPGFPSQRPGIRPRNEAASTAERRTTSGPPISGAAYVSATSYAAYVSNICMGIGHGQ